MIAVVLFFSLKLASLVLARGRWMRFQHTCILKTIRFTTQDCYIQKWFLIRDLKGFIFKRIFKEYNLRLKNKQFIEQISMAGLLIERSMCFRLALQTNYDREIS